jgi:hypothetical protein
MKKTIKLTLMATGLLTFAGLALAHSGNNSADVIHACVHKKTKVVRIMSGTAACSGKETASHWGISGPAGASGTGIVGSVGATGPQGPKGDPGTATLAVGDALAAVLDDIANDVSVAQSPGTCNSNPYPATFNSSLDPWTSLNPPCPPVAVECPAGSILANGACDLIPPSDAERLAILDQLSQVSFSPVIDLGKPFTKTTSKVGAALAKNKLECATPKIFNPADKGYTPWCVFIVANVMTPPPGVTYALPVKSYTETFDSNFVFLGYSPVIHLRHQGSFLVDAQDNLIEITTQQLNNPANYTCHAINFQATARCVTEPTNLLNKLLN